MTSGYEESQSGGLLSSGAHEVHNTKVDHWVRSKSCIQDCNVGLQLVGVSDIRYIRVGEIVKCCELKFLLSSSSALRSLSELCLLVVSVTSARWTLNYPGFMQDDVTDVCLNNPSSSFSKLAITTIPRQQSVRTQTIGCSVGRE